MLTWNSRLLCATLLLFVLPLPASAQTTQTLGPPVSVTVPQQNRRRNRGNRNRQNNPNGQRGRRGANTLRTRSTAPVGRGGNLLLNLVPGGAKSSAPVFANGMAYLASWNGRVYALDAATGEKKWAFQGGDLFNASPAIGPDGTVYVGCYDHNVYALDGKTGAKKWTFAAGGLLNTAPALSPQGDKVYVGGFDHTLYALYAKTGKAVWQYKTAAAVCAPRVGADGTVYAGADRVYAVNGKTGKPLWATSADFSGAAGIALSADDGTVYAPSHDAAGQDTLNAVNSRTGKVFWSAALPLSPSAPPTVMQERLYVSAGTLLCLRAGSGRPVWQYGSGQTGQPAVSENGTLLAADGGDQTLSALSAADGSQRWAFPTSDPLVSDPAFGPDGNIYAASEGEGKVYCLNARNGSVVWTFAQDAVPTPPATVQKGRRSK